MVIAPRYLCGQWEDAIKQEHPDAKIALTEGVRYQRERTLAKHADWYIVNPEMVKSYDMPVGMRTFINDESHHLRNRNADHSKAVYLLENIDRTARIYNLTATPFYKTVDDIWMQARILYPQVFTSYRNFVKTYCVSLRTPYGTTKVIGVNRAMREGMKDLFAPIMLGRTYKQVGRYLPEIIETQIKVSMNKALRMMYDKLRMEYSMQWEDEENRQKLIFNPTTVLHVLRQVTFQAGKIDAIKGIIEDNNDEPAVIGLWYKDHAALVQKQLKNSVLITGDMDAIARQRLAKQAEARGQHIVASEKSLAEGINLSKYRLFIFGEEHYVPGANHQFLSRVVRDRNDGGKDRTPVRVFYVLASNSIDIHIHRISTQRNKANNSVRQLLGLTLG